MNTAIEHDHAMELTSFHSLSSFTKALFEREYDCQLTAMIGNEEEFKQRKPAGRASLMRKIMDTYFERYDMPPDFEDRLRHLLHEHKMEKLRDDLFKTPWHKAIYCL